MKPEIKKILYATDLSPNSAYAMRYALQSAKFYNAEVIIMHAFETAYIGYAPHQDTHLGYTVTKR